MPDTISQLRKIKDRFEANIDKHFPLSHLKITWDKDTTETDRISQGIVKERVYPLYVPGFWPERHEYIFGDDLSGLPVLRCILQRLFTLVHGLKGFRLTEDKRNYTSVVPPPMHWMLEKTDIEHDWLNWMDDLLTDEDCEQALFRGKVAEPYQNPGNGKLQRSGYLFAPDGRPLGRFHNGDYKHTEHPYFKAFLKLVKAGNAPNIRIFRGDKCDVFEASVLAMDRLMERLKVTQDGGITAEGLASSLKMTSDRVNYYAKAVEVPTPKKGQRNFLYPYTHVKRICARIKDKGNGYNRTAATHVLATLPE